MGVGEVCVRVCTCVCVCVCILPYLPLWAKGSSSGYVCWYGCALVQMNNSSNITIPALCLLYQVPQYTATEGSLALNWL